ncbi:hypothetical protein [Verticiella sediminum]|uniref:hypothetical protein n=1 Tax=Verticiella sediminum TaxID=1247510 RepID=UPI001FE7DF4E|nr:hypothetical protein [Verticiella sediminum]
MTQQLTPTHATTDAGQGERLAQAIAIMLAAQGIAASPVETKAAARVWQRLAPPMQGRG